MSKSRKIRRKDRNDGEKTPRRLFVIDIENLCGKPVIEESDVKAVQRFVNEALSLSTNDLVVIGTSHTNNFVSAGVAWKGVRQVFKPGHDGADLALLAAINEYNVETFEEIVIMSGDGIFADAVDEIAARSVIVTVMSIGRCLSKKLGEAASLVRFVDEAAIAA